MTESFLELDFDPHDFEPMHPEELVALDLSKYATYFLSDVVDAHTVAPASHLVTMASGTSLRLLARTASDESIGSRAARALHGHPQGFEDPDALYDSNTETPMPTPRLRLAPTFIEPPPTAGSARAWARSFELSPRPDNDEYAPRHVHAATRPSMDVHTPSMNPGAVSVAQGIKNRRASAPPQGRTRKDSLPRKVAQRLRLMFSPPPSAVPDDVKFPVAQPMRRAASSQ